MFSRIESVIDVPQIQRKHATIIGAGGSATLVGSLFRSGLGAATLVDPQSVELANIARQDHQADCVGMPKVEALAHQIRRINQQSHVTALKLDFCAMSDHEVDANFGHTDLFIFGTDSFKAQSRGNEVALRLGKPAIWPGLYQTAAAGEIIFWHSDIPACYRCLCAKRYAAHAAAQRDHRQLDPPSDGATIFDIAHLDSIVGMIAIGLLTRGANNRFGRLIDQLGDRNFLQVKIDPQWTWNGHDIIRELLGVPETNDNFFSWNTVVRRDPDGGQPPCPDCVKHRGRQPLQQG